MTSEAPADPIYYSFDTVITLAELEKKHIITALHRANGNKTIASQNLGITIKTLYNKLHQYGMMGDKNGNHQGTDTK